MRFANNNSPFVLSFSHLNQCKSVCVWVCAYTARQVSGYSFTFVFKCEYIQLAMADSKCCEDEISDLQKKVEEYSSKLKQLKQSYEKSLIENLKKDVIIQQLKKKIETNKSNSKWQYISISRSLCGSVSFCFVLFRIVLFRIGKQYLSQWTQIRLHLSGAHRDKGFCDHIFTVLQKCSSCLSHT